MAVTVYTKNNCVQCKMTKKTLEQYGIDFVEKNIEEDAQSMTTLKNQGYQAVPVVFADQVEPIKGFRPDLLKQLKVAI